MLDIEGFRKAGYQAIDRICDYYYSLESKSVKAQVEPGYLRKLLPEQAPEKGEDFAVIADDFQKFIIPGVTHWQHPSYFAYFPCTSPFEGTLGDLYASSMSSANFNWICSPAATELEAICMDWAGRLFGFDDIFMTSSGKGGGVIQPTASDTALTAVVAARNRFQTLHPEVRHEQLVIYGTTMTHSLGAKAGLILGVKFKALEVTKEDSYALRGNILKKTLEEDRTNGLQPFIFIATMGTTSSGAVDRLDEIGAVLFEHPDIWLHLDAAWAGIALCCPEFREMSHLDAINKYCHSICINFHKWGLVNFSASGMWVRDRRLLTETLDVTPEFLRTAQSDSGTVIDYRNWCLSLGRRFRSLKLWFVLRGYGVEGFRNHVRKCVKQANLFADLIKASSTFELVTPPSYALVVFRAVKAGASLDELNALNRVFFKYVSQRPDIFVIQTDLEGVYCLRFVVGAERTEDRHIQAAVQLFEEEAKKAFEEWGKQQVE